MRLDAISSVTARQLEVVPSTSLSHDAIERLLDRDTRFLVVCNEMGRAVGVVTRVDILRYLVSRTYRPNAPVAELMTTDVTFAREHDDLLDVWALMHARDLNRVPVLNERDVPLGVLTINVALNALLEQEQSQELELTNYIGGSGYR